MPYVLKHKTTSQLYSCLMKNNYNLVYYGVKYWDWEDEANKEAAEFLGGQGAEDSAEWEVFRMEENRIKLCNVKLKSNPALIVSLTEEDQLRVQPRP
ncbi:hypothetical protein EYB31_08270 [Paenibacillus thalictri]|uniref:Uncharacterized protein n=2 Tax=Paenibacillus thalictri TaxID=2527873 RepID=A0A4Q9DYT4_9BACL|nr:hypothetical protein EYB31_08270 [Paenibacillus thalictri]